MINLTFKQLRYFEALAREGHFGRAAAACSISQPALSMQIKELEAIVGSALFERGARHVRLTGYGEQFATRAADIVRAVEELEDMARSGGGALAGRLRLGVIPTIAPYLLPAILRDLGQAYHGLDIHVRETLTPRLIAELADGKLDAALVALPVSEPAFIEQALFSEEFLLVRPARDEGLPVPNGEALRKMRLLLLEEGHCFRDQALSFCQVRPTVPRDGLDGSSLSTLVQMVGAGIGVTLIPQMAARVETLSADVCVARFPSPAPERTIGLIWRKTSVLSNQMQGLAQVIHRSAMPSTAGAP